MNWIRALRTLAVTVIGVIVLLLFIAMLAYPPVYVFRAVAWQGSDAFDWQKFPSHPLHAAPTTYHFKKALDPRVAELFGRLSGTDNWDRFLEENQTQAFIVIQDGTVL